MSSASQKSQTTCQESTPLGAAVLPPPAAQPTQSMQSTQESDVEAVLEFESAQQLGAFLKSVDWTPVKELEILLGIIKDEDVRPDVRLRALKEFQDRRTEILEACGLKARAVCTRKGDDGEELAFSGNIVNAAMKFGMPGAKPGALPAEPKPKKIKGVKNERTTNKRGPRPKSKRKSKRKSKSRAQRGARPSDNKDIGGSTTRSPARGGGTAGGRAEAKRIASLEGVLSEGSVPSAEPGQGGTEIGAEVESILLEA